MSFFVLWLGVMFPLVFSPGPANVVFAASGAKVGVRRSLPLLCGVDSVFILQSMLVGFGFDQVIMRHPLLLQVLQFVGSAYIIYLAIGFLLSGLQSNLASEKIMGFKDGIIIQTLNAKGWLMIILMFSLFAEPAKGIFGGAATWALIVMLALLNISLHLVWIKGGQLITLFVTSKRNQQIQNWGYFASLLLVALWLIADNPFWAQSTV